MKPRNSQTQPADSAASSAPGTSQFPPGLYLVATPIGNLKDITLRALELLAIADLILCEDTRVTAKLLSHYGISKPTLSYNDHNGEGRRPRIMEALAQGQRIALVSDAGTPLVSDPGYKLALEVRAAGHYVTALPGASSVLTALCLSGLPTDRFFFAGFLPAKSGACKKELAALAAIPATLVFFESARRLPDTLALMAEILGEREATVARELTKLFEESRTGTLADLAAHYEKEGPPKGEVVIVVGAGHAQQELSADDISQQLETLLLTHSVKEAAALLAQKTGLPRKELYALALQRKNHG